MSYYDIDSILTDAEKIPCTFQLDIPDLGYLDNSPGQPLKAGTTVNLPLWLAEMLVIANTGSVDNNTFVTFDLPPALGNDVVSALKADPRAVPLRDRSAHFYGLATHMMDLSEEQELGQVLRKTFVSRATEIALHARKVGGTGHGHKGKGKDESSNLGLGNAGEEFLRGLDDWERKLFRKAHEGAKAGKEWMESIKKY
ncbi:DNA replication complex GINS protein psf3 [Podospora australis]|uniref:DNA replication complex GINS protein PSF3 n=1 Tax=Podospora australis TaxID=1536484 RepID=A0AAN6WKI5_9PEZI|nr:DNA replication complex GINS protein psf3 [Podospora australis]